VKINKMSEKEGWFTRKRKELGNRSIVEYYDEGKFVSLGSLSHRNWQHREIDRVTETTLQLLYELPGMYSGGYWIDELAATCDFIGDSYKALAKLIKGRKKIK